jgi:hypothetical protein
MKNHLRSGALGALFVLLSPVTLPASDYTFFVRQIQMPDEVGWDVTVAQEGSQLSPLAINPFGARFELWAVRSAPLAAHLLDTTYVNSYVPVAQIQIQTEDPYEAIKRTRADRPFYVSITVAGLLSDPDAPAAAKAVKLLRHGQAYPAGSDGTDINRGLATLISQGSLTENGTQILYYPVNAVPGGDRSKVRGEERFSAFSLEDYGSPESQLNSQMIQIWPVADSSIEGIDAATEIKGIAPDVTIQLVDLYPESVTYARVYKGDPDPYVEESTLVPGASIVVSGAVPRNESIFVKNWDSVIPSDGKWTLEVLTNTPFGIDRLGYTTFEVKRSIKVNGAVTSAD